MNETRDAPRSATFTMLGPPRSWKRAGVTKGGRRYTTEGDAANRKRIAWAWLAVRPPGWPLEARYSVELHVYPETRRAFDLDNAAKCALDALNGHAWADDSRVDVLHVERHYGEEPRIEMRICILA